MSETENVIKKIEDIQNKRMSTLKVTRLGLFIDFLFLLACGTIVVLWMLAILWIANNIL